MQAGQDVTLPGLAARAAQVHAEAIGGLEYNSGVMTGVLEVLTPA